MPEILNLGEDPRPYLKVNVLGMECDGLLDSGSSCTILGKEGMEFVKSLRLTGTPSNIAIKTADGTVHIALCRVDIPFQLKNVVRVVPTLPIPSLGKHLILGMDFWKVFGLSPQFSTNNFSTNAVDSKHESMVDNCVETIEKITNNTTLENDDECLSAPCGTLVDFDFSECVEMSSEQKSEL